MPNKRTYGTGHVRHLYGNEWQLKYRPPWATKPQYKQVEATDKKTAEDLLHDWRKELEKQKKEPVALSIQTLHDLLMADYRRKKRATTADTSQKWKKHLDAYFDERDLVELDDTDVEEYIDDKLEEGLSNATVNRHVSWLHKALRLARKRKLTKAAFEWERMDERDGIRQGFLSHEEYLAILRLLPDYLQILWCFAYHWGLRKGELLKLRWEWALPYLSDDEPIIKIPGFDTKTKTRITKSGDPHTLPLYSEEMREFLKMALMSRNPKCPYIIQYRGRQLKEPKESFNKARHAAKLDHVLIHDTRRTAIRNMTSAGISKRDAKQISGHKTDSVFDRYDIAAEDGAVKTGQTMREFMAKESRKVADRQKIGAEIGAEKLGQDRKGEALVDRKLLN